MREGMFGVGFALPGDPVAAITLGDMVLWAVFCGHLDRAEALIESCSEAAVENAAAADRAQEIPSSPPAGNRRRVFPYRYAWNRMERKDQRCAVLVRGKMNSCLVEFEDGFQAITSRNAVRRVK
jgi:hypothetical protein